ncbi:MAG: hypothetical protein OEL89_00725 [Candidatus Peregrinibacteria bacterium]|nr:hypothetical protein [Candidatus Peregrinibacteria bacterium]
MNNDWFPKFIQVRREDLTPNVIDKIEKCESMYSRNMFVLVNSFIRDEITNIEYVRSDKYYEALKIISDLVTTKHRLMELDEKACSLLLDS